MTRIFLTLAALSNLSLAAAFLLGWKIDDAASLQEDARNLVTWHLLTGLAAALVVLLVHAVVLTYFMGTGRWLEETCEAYGLGSAARQENIRLKYRVIPGMCACICLVIATGALGAMADPAANMRLSSGAALHLAAATATLAANLLVSCIQYRAIARNGAIVDEVVARAQQMRQERRLEPAAPIA